MADNVVILEPGDERAQKISKAMASQTASDILQLLAENKKSLTEITDRLAIPLTTAKYHIENLLEAGLITVAEIKYSVKGREIKIYAITNQLLIVAPRQSNVRSLLLKYASLFCIVVLGTLALSLTSPLLANFGSGMNAPSAIQADRETGIITTKAVAESYWSNATMNPEVNTAVSKGISDGAAANLTPPPSPLATLGQAPLVTAVPLPPGSGAHAAAALPDPALAFFLGGLLVILVLVVYEVYLWKKMKSPRG
jgi:DNA-binding transcriptional ArsR family regulator